jgi:hypothetical protein
MAMAETKEEGLICGIVDQDTGVKITFALESKNFFWRIEQKYVEFLKEWVSKNGYICRPKPVLYFEQADGKREFVKSNYQTQQPLVLESKVLFGDECRISFVERTLLAIEELFKEEISNEALCCQ